MSLFFRGSRPTEDRQISWPFNYGDGVGSSTSGVEGSLSLVPVYASVRLISDSIASLPLQQFRKTATGRAPMPLARVLDQPSTYGTRMEWVQRGLVSGLTRGNAYGLKTGFDPETSGYRSVEWLNPDRVQYRDSKWYYEGREVAEAQMLHIPGLVVPGSRLGISPMKAARATVESGTSTQAFMRDWFTNRAIPGLLFKNTEKTLKPDEAAVIQERLQATLRSGKPFVSGSDWSMDIMKLPADDAGFVQSARLNATQIAAIYGVPPEMIGGETGGSSLTYSTVELNQIQFLTNTLRPWITRFETALSSLLPRPQFVKFNVEALLRMDTKTRYEVHKISREIGLNNIDELRVHEDMDPLPDDKGQDYTPLAKVGTTAPKEIR